MAGLSLNRPAEAVLAARIARHYYLEGVSKMEIADRLGISRFRVARLLDAARTSGMVRIEIGLPGGRLDIGLSAELCSAFGLKHAFVYTIADRDETALRNRIGEAAGQVLTDLIGPEDVLGIAWSRSLGALTAALTRFPPCPIVQLTGAVPLPGGKDLLTLVRSVAGIGGGAAHVYYAPMLPADPEAAAAIRRQPDVAATFALVPTITVALLSVGAWAPGLSTIYDAVSPAEQETIRRQGAHIELAGALYDRDARALTTTLESRMINTPAPALARIPTVLAVCYGIAKTDAALSALRGGLVNGLITHTSLARAILDAAAQG
jgi:DNA-binding transcriptional regulator LsrR (DeoR family)